MEIGDWHERYMEQARWTASARRFLCQKARITPSTKILEVGCGTGAILGRLAVETNAQIAGIDISHSALSFAKGTSNSKLVCADAINLPFATHSFDACVCHFFLLWVKNPNFVLREMKRISRPGGVIIAFGEPDYGGRIDYPEEKVELGRLQTQALIDQGADPEAGRKLKALFSEAGLANVVCGVLGGEWSPEFSEVTFKSEWEILEEDLKFAIPKPRLEELKKIDRSAWNAGQRILFIPTFYCIGWNPG